MSSTPYAEQPAPPPSSVAGSDIPTAATADGPTSGDGTLARLEIETTIGRLLLTARGPALRRIDFVPPEAPAAAPPAAPDVHPEGERQDGAREVLRQAATQLAEYFDGRRTSFELSYEPEGTPFQRNVWEALARIPYGSTLSYAELAALIGRPRAIRAVGAANGANPLPIVVPCHRVIGTDGSLTGYAGGVSVKRRLLDLERGTPA